MAMFVEVEGEAAIIVERGVYKQVPVFTRNGFLYAKAAGGFVRLYADGSTTKPHCRLDTLTWEGPLCRDGLGKLCSPEVAGSLPLASPQRQLLLGAGE